jgi:hypothetical protein
MELTDEEIMFAFQGDEGVIRLRDVIERSGVVCLHAVEVYSPHRRMTRIFFERRDWAGGFFKDSDSDERTKAGSGKQAAGDEDGSVDLQIANH